MRCRVSKLYDVYVRVEPVDSREDSEDGGDNADSSVGRGNVSCKEGSGGSKEDDSSVVVAGSEDDGGGEAGSGSTVSDCSGVGSNCCCGDVGIGDVGIS